MTEKVVTVAEERTVYVASDGREFSSKKECREHEENLTKRCFRDVVEKLPCFSLSLPVTDEPCRWVWYYISSVVELSVVRCCLFDTNVCSSPWDYEPTQYPCWLCFVLEGNHSGTILGTPEEVSSLMTHFTTRLNELVDAKTPKNSKSPFNKYKDVCEALGWRVFQLNDDAVGLRKESPSGMTHDIIVQPLTIVEDVIREAVTFDVDEYVLRWNENRGMSGVPATIHGLLEAAEAIRAMLNELAEALSSARNEGVLAGA